MQTEDNIMNLSVKDKDTTIHYHIVFGARNKPDWSYLPIDHTTNKDKGLNKGRGVMLKKKYACMQKIL